MRSATTITTWNERMFTSKRGTHKRDWQKRVSTRFWWLYEGMQLRVRAHFSVCQLLIFSFVFPLLFLIFDTFSFHYLFYVFRLFLYLRSWFLISTNFFYSLLSYKLTLFSETESSLWWNHQSMTIIVGCSPWNDVANRLLTHITWCFCCV